MKCNDFRDVISLYIDNRLDESGKEKVSKHLKECKACKDEYEDLLRIRGILIDSPIEDLPEGFKEELHHKLIKCKQDEKETNAVKSTPINTPISKKRKFNWRTFSAVAALLLIMVISVATLNQFGLRGQRSEMAQDNAAQEEYGIMESKMAAPEVAEAPMEAPMNDQRLLEQRGQGDIQFSTAEDIGERALREPNNRKIILNSYLQLDVEDYDLVHDKIIDMTISKGGFIQSSNTRYKYFNRTKIQESLKEGNLTLRVPENEFYSTLNYIKELGTVIDSRINTSDITREYRDTVNEIENLKIQEERLRNIMEEASNVSEVLEVEKELSRVRGDINRLTGNIKAWDNLVSLSTIEVYLNQVSHGDVAIHTIDEGIWAKSKKGFIRTINNLINLTEGLVIKFISIIPIIIVVIILLGLLYLMLRRIRNKKMEG